jgi:hypothetical protein
MAAMRCDADCIPTKQRQLFLRPLRAGNFSFAKLPLFRRKSFLIYGIVRVAFAWTKKPRRE